MNKYSKSIQFTTTTEVPMRNSMLVLIIGLLLVSFVSLTGCTEKARLENHKARVKAAQSRMILEEQTKAAFFSAVKENSFRGKIVKLEPSVREEPMIFSGNKRIEEILVKAESNGKNFYFAICASRPNNRSPLTGSYDHPNGRFQDMLARHGELSFRKFCFDLTPGMPIIILSSVWMEPEKLHERISMHFVYTDHADIPHATSIFGAINADSTHS